MKRKNIKEMSTAQATLFSSGYAIFKWRRFHWTGHLNAPQHIKNAQALNYIELFSFDHAFSECGKMWIEEEEENKIIIFLTMIRKSVDSVFIL